MNSSGFDEKLIYNTCKNDENNKEKKKKRKRKIIWYNPPFSLNVKSNAGKLFFKILAKIFPKSNPFNPINLRYSIRTW